MTSVQTDQSSMVKEVDSTRGFRVRALPPELANMLWPTYLDKIKEAMATHPSETHNSLVELRTDIRKGRALVLQMYEDDEVAAVGVVEIVDQSDGKMLYIRYLAGDGMEYWLDELHELLIEIAGNYGCQWLGLTGRLGWQRALKHLGFEPVAVELRAGVEAWAAA